MEDRIGYMALEKQTTVYMSNMASAHVVAFTVKPSAGLGNAIAGLEQDQIPHEVTQMASGRMVQGYANGSPDQYFENDVEFRLTEGGRPGNLEETWTFYIPH